MRPVVQLGLGVLVVSMEACDSTPPTAAGLASSRATSSLVGQATHLSPVETLDDKFAAIADSIPGFGGLFVSNGELYAYLSDSSQEGRLRSRLAEDNVLAHHRGKPLHISRGSFDYRALKRWNDQLSSLLAAVPGVAWFDINEVENRLNVGVTNATLISDVHQAALNLAIPPAALRVVLTSMPPVHSDFLTSNHIRPFGAGMIVSISGKNVDGWISWGGGCTAGFTVWNPNGHHWMIENSHCTAALWYNDWTYLYQSSNDTVSVVGGEDMDPGPFYGGACPSGMACRWSESVMMVVWNDSDASAHRGWIARTTYSDPFQGSMILDTPPNNAFVVSGNSIDYPLAGEESDLMGSTSGWTTGTVTSTCRNTGLGGVLSHIHFSGQPYLLCQFITSATSRPGDSSEPVFRRLGTFDADGREQVHLQGVAWGGTGQGASATWFSPLAGVNSDHLLQNYLMSWGY